MLLTKSLTCMTCSLFFYVVMFIFFHVVFKVCIYADPCTVYEQKQRGQRVGEENLKKESGQN